MSCVSFCLLLTLATFAASMASADDASAGLEGATERASAAKSEEQTSGSSSAVSQAHMPTSQIPVFDLFGPSDVWDRLGSRPPMVIGAWVEYVSYSDEENESTIRISVVPQRGLPTEDHRVVEIRIVEPTGDRNYLKILLGAETEHGRQLQALQVKQASAPLIELPLNPEAGARIDASLQDPSELRVERSGVVELETPVGTHRSRRVRVFSPGSETPQLDAWMDIDGRVPLTGIVKRVDGNSTLMLSGYGDGARSDLPPIRVPQ